MSDSIQERIVSLLEEIRDGQKLQLERQAEIMARQAETAARQRERSTKTDKLVDDAANLQKSATRFHEESVRLIRQSRLILFLAVPVTVALVVLALSLAFYRVAS